MKEKGENQKVRYTLGSLKPQDAEVVFKSLEEPNWAPWLAASSETIERRAEVFSEGQLVIIGLDGTPLASLSMNRISWDGNPKMLPSWDEVAGEPTTYENTYQPDGNTLVMMSMNVNPKFQGEGYARILIEQAKLVAEKLGIHYLLGSFRPNEYGKHKLSHLNNHLSFEEYCNTRRADDWPVDGWLRNLSRNGMQPLAVDHKAMVVQVSLAEFNNLKVSYNKDSWIEVNPGEWECGEVGCWTIDEHKSIATYQESNLWGVVWTKTGLQ